MFWSLWRHLHCTVLLILFLENHYDLCYTECDAVVTNQNEDEIIPGVNL